MRKLRYRHFGTGSKTAQRRRVAARFPMSPHRRKADLLKENSRLLLHLTPGLPSVDAQHRSAMTRGSAPAPGQALTLSP